MFYLVLEIFLKKQIYSQHRKGRIIMNRIPRTATKLEVTFLSDTSASKTHDKCIVEKTDRGWVGNINGENYLFFVQHLRNENYCALKVVA